MNNKSIFKPIDMAVWPMAQSYYYYTQMAPTSYSVTVMIDVTESRRALKNQGYKFFPAYLYLVTRVINSQPGLRVAVQDGVTGHWNTLEPVYPQFHDDDQTTSLLWTEYSDSFSLFHSRYLADTADHGDSHGILSSKGIPPVNSYVISCIPWFTFQSFSLQNHGSKDYFFPSFEAGGFVTDGDRIRMPLSVTVHHATTDGYHLKCFFQALQKLLDHPEKWLG